MTKKDYIVVAAALREQLPRRAWLNKWQQYEAVCSSLAAAFLKDNPRFDRERFMVACGIEGEA